MAKCYAILGVSGSGTSEKTLATVVGASTVRPRVYDIVLGNAETPADYAWSFVAQRLTADGTGTAHTPRPLDPGDPVAQCTSKITHTVEPTYTASAELLELNANMRTAVRWTALTEGRELVGPATANNGLGFVLNTATTALVLRGTFLFQE